MDFLNELPVTPLDPVNDPNGMLEQAELFARWFHELPNSPVRLTVDYAPFDAVPRSWSFDLTDPADRQQLLVVRVFDNQFTNVMGEAEHIAFAPDEFGDDYEPNWKMGLLTLLTTVEATAADMQTALLAHMYEYIGWDCQKFLEETDPFLSKEQQRIFLQGYSYMYELEKILREKLDDLSPIEQATFRLAYDDVRKEYEDTLARLRAEFDASFDDEINKILDGGI